MPAGAQSPHTSAPFASALSPSPSPWSALDPVADAGIFDHNPFADLPRSSSPEPWTHTSSVFSTSAFSPTAFSPSVYTPSTASAFSPSASSALDVTLPSPTAPRRRHRRHSLGPATSPSLPPRAPPAFLSSFPSSPPPDDRLDHGHTHTHDDGDQDDGEHPLRRRSSSRSVRSSTRPRLRKLLRADEDEEDKGAGGDGDASASTEREREVRRGREERRAVVVHRVEPTDSLAGIALRYGIAPADLRRANQLWPADPVHMRAVLYVPVDQARRARLALIEAAAASVPAVDASAGDTTLPSPSSPSQPISPSPYSPPTPSRPSSARTLKLTHTRSATEPIIGADALSLARGLDTPDSTPAPAPAPYTIARVPAAQLSFFPPPAQRAHERGASASAQRTHERGASASASASAQNDYFAPRLRLTTSTSMSASAGVPAYRSAETRPAPRRGGSGTDAHASYRTSTGPNTERLRSPADRVSAASLFSSSPSVFASASASSPFSPSTSTFATATATAIAVQHARTAPSTPTPSDGVPALARTLGRSAGALAAFVRAALPEELQLRRGRSEEGGEEVELAPGKGLGLGARESEREAGLRREAVSRSPVPRMRAVMFGVDSKARPAAPGAGAGAGEEIALATSPPRVRAQPAATPRMTVPVPGGGKAHARGVGEGGAGTVGVR